MNPSEDHTDLLERIADLEDQVLDLTIDRDDLQILLTRERAFSRTWKGLYELESKVGLSEKVATNLDEIGMTA